MVTLEAILEKLEPDRIRALFLRPYGTWRESFEPRFLVTDSHEAMMEELGRFVGHVQERWFGGRVAWPAAYGREQAAQLLKQELGDSRDPRSGELAAMRICRHGERGGMRYLLDVLSDALLRQALGQYVDAAILPDVFRLTGEESLELARRYVATFGAFPAAELDSPASIALRWRQVLHGHAQRVAFG